MKKKYIVLPVFLMAMAFVGVAFAEETTVVNTTTSVPPAVPTTSTPKPPLMKVEREKMREENKIERKDMRIENKDIRENTKSEIKTIREEKKEQLKDMRNEGKTEYSLLREELKKKVESGEITKEEAYKQFNEAMKVSKEQTKTEIMKVRTDFKTAVKEKKGDAKELIEEKRESTLLSIQEKREAFKQEMEMRKEDAKAKGELAKGELKKGLIKVGDENKKISVENITESLKNINTKAVENFTNNIDKIESVLVSVESRSDKAALNGLNVEAVVKAISEAETAIASARTNITNQAGKVYTVTITDEATLKTTMKTVRDSLKKDIDVVQTSMKQAREAVRKATILLNQIPGINNDLNVSPTVGTETTTN